MGISHPVAAQVYDAASPAPEWARRLADLGRGELRRPGGLGAPRALAVVPGAALQTCAPACKSKGTKAGVRTGALHRRAKRRGVAHAGVAGIRRDGDGDDEDGQQRASYRGRKAPERLPMLSRHASLWGLALRHVDVKIGAPLVPARM